MTWDDLARLWLREPDERALESAEGLGLSLSGATPNELAADFSELFLLNVYPYGSVFTDPSGELNGRFASWAASRYERRSYLTPEFWEAGAPDHVGLCVGYLGHLEKIGETDPDFSLSLQEWLPVCALAVERDPSAAELYRALAQRTRAAVMRDEPRGQRVLGSPEEDGTDGAFENDEIHLSDVLSYLLAPARSGFFLSRSRLGKIARQSGLQLPFGGRYEVARALFGAAGEAERVREVLGALAEETDAWETAYAGWESEHASWSRFATLWRSRIGRTRCRLAAMEDLLHRPLDLEYTEDASR